MDNITLIGMPGSGKSTVGVLLAKVLGYGFLDTDLLIQQREGALLQSILDCRGADYFLAAEEQAVRSVDCSRHVIAPGGSVVYSACAMERLKELGIVVYLEMPLEELIGRIDNMGSRGVVMEPGQTLSELYEVRVPLYRRYADYTVACGGQTLEQTVGAVLSCLDHRTPASGV